MKFSFILSIIFMFVSISMACAASNYDDYMEGHPSYNDNYYTPSYNNSHSTPNNDSDYYDRQYSYNNSYDNGSNDPPQDSGIRDYDPYYYD